MRNFDDRTAPPDEAHPNAPTPTSPCQTRRWPPVPPGKRRIFRPWRTLPDGSREYASKYGKRVFVWEVDE